MLFSRRANPDLTPLAGQPGWFSALLRQRGVKTEEEARRYLFPSLDLLSDPFVLSGMKEAVSLLKNAVARQDPVLIWGDYDADGVCAASILWETLKEAGAVVSCHLPLRGTEGYGLNSAVLLEKASSFRLLITVDCGISNHEEVSLAKSLGKTVIITDHHVLPDALPEADAVVNPLLDPDTPCRSLCGAGVALKICQALLGMEGLVKRLDLAAIATVADVVPLEEENRLIVREGLARIASSPRPGLQALLKTAGITPPVRSDHLAFRLGPRINSAGRLSDARIAARLLLTKNPSLAEQLARELEALNTRRQAMEREITGEAVRLAESRDDLSDTCSLVILGNGWNPGLIGLTAGRLCERYFRPVVVLSAQGDTAVGSCRSIPGVDISGMLQACGDLLERFGGHAQAAGLTIRLDRIEAFRSRLEEVIRASCPEECFHRRLEYDLEIPFQEWTEESLALLDQLEPVGCGNPAPVFLLSGASVQSMRPVGRDLSHLQLFLLDSENLPVKGIAFSQAETADRGYTNVDILYRPILNEFRGRVTVEAQISAIRSAGATG